MGTSSREQFIEGIRALVHLGSSCVDSNQGDLSLFFFILLDAPVQMAAGEASFVCVLCYFSLKNITVPCGHMTIEPSSWMLLGYLSQATPVEQAHNSHMQKMNKQLLKQSWKWTKWMSSALLARSK